jgi:uncharacterized protein YidB (DUF937 family)
MSFLSQLEGGLGNLLAQNQGNLGGLFNEALQGIGGYQAVIAKLSEAGLGQQVQSWLATNGSNLPVTPQQIEAALGNQQLQSLAKSFGVPVDQIANLLAQHLPNAVDQASPNGELVINATSAPSSSA